MISQRSAGACTRCTRSNAFPAYLHMRYFKRKNRTKNLPKNSPPNSKIMNPKSSDAYLLKYTASLKTQMKINSIKCLAHKIKSPIPKLRIQSFTKYYYINLHFIFLYSIDIRIKMIKGHKDIELKFFKQGFLRNSTYSSDVNVDCRCNLMWKYVHLTLVLLCCNFGNAMMQQKNRCY